MKRALIFWPSRKKTASTRQNYTFDNYRRRSAQKVPGQQLSASENCLPEIDDTRFAKQIRRASQPEQKAAPRFINEKSCRATRYGKTGHVVLFFCDPRSTHRLFALSFCMCAAGGSRVLWCRSLARLLYIYFAHWHFMCTEHCIKDWKMGPAVWECRGRVEENTACG